jgi:opacity protein-like surface antigen
MTVWVAVRVLAVAGILALWSSVPKAHAFDPHQTFAKGTYAVSVEGGYGEQVQLADETTGLDFVNAGVRVGFFPWGIRGPGVLAGALEIGLEPLYQQFFDPVDAYFAGLAAVTRYHLTSIGRLVPYVELAGAAGYTDLRVREQDTNFVFLLFGGVGASYFITERTSIYAGYRFQHISNAGTDSPNRGIDSHTGVLGVSRFFR